MEPCDGCGKLYPLHLLDAKPQSLAGVAATHQALFDAASRGEDFDRFECRGCYGPAWEAADAS